MIALGFIMQRPLDRAMKRLQAESAARHGVLVESPLRSRDRPCHRRRSPHADRLGALGRRHGAIGRGRAFLVFADIDQRQLRSADHQPADGRHRRLSHSRRKAHRWAPWSPPTCWRAAFWRPIAGIASIITRGTQTLSSLKSIDRIMSLERERSPERAYVTRKISEGRISFENVSFTYPNAPGKALDKVSFKIEAGETDRHHRPRRLGQNHGRPPAARFL